MTPVPSSVEAFERDRQRAIDVARQSGAPAETIAELERLTFDEMREHDAARASQLEAARAVVARCETIGASCERAIDRLEGALASDDGAETLEAVLEGLTALDLTISAGQTTVEETRDAGLDEIACLAHSGRAMLIERQRHVLASLARRPRERVQQPRRSRARARGRRDGHGRPRASRGPPSDDDDSSCSHVRRGRR